MNSLTLSFKGWFLCRLATDPDPTDEPRGVSGSTFALPGEPDLDRIIVMQDPPPEVVRSCSPRIGVYVTSAKAAGRKVDALLGARVNLLDGPRFENRNFVLTVAGYEPIVPFHLEVRSDDLRLARSTVLWSEHPDLPVHQVPRERLERMGARGLRTDPEQVLAETGVDDPLDNRRERRRTLARELSNASDPLLRAGLARRIAELDIGLADPTDERVVNLTAIEEFTLELAGPATVQGQLPDNLQVDVEPPWLVDFWMGGWDADLCCGFMKGQLQVPLVRRQDP